MNNKTKLRTFYIVISLAVLCCLAAYLNNKAINEQIITLTESVDESEFLGTAGIDGELWNI